MHFLSSLSPSKRHQIFIRKILWISSHLWSNCCPCINNLDILHGSKITILNCSEEMLSSFEQWLHSSLEVFFLITTKYSCSIKKNYKRFRNCIKTWWLKLKDIWHCKPLKLLIAHTIDQTFFSFVSQYDTTVIGNLLYWIMPILQYDC